MQAFIIVIMIENILSLIVRSFDLSFQIYPIKRERSRGMDVLSIFENMAFLIWAAYLIYF